VAVRPDIIEAVATTNGAYLQKLAGELRQRFKVSLITIADKSGTVIARGHSSKAGDSVPGQTNVLKALAGEAFTAIEEGTVVKFSLRTGHPLKKGSQAIGTVTVGMDVSADNSFVDFIKHRYQVECTVFQKDTRVSTTLERDGQRLVGTKPGHRAG
jgi:methyl-accepting chemotaxis protein